MQHFPLTVLRTPLKALSCALALLAALPAAAQNITVYGVVDLFVGSFKGSPGSSNVMGDGGLAASRLGVRGTEDLGGGMLAEFTLESSMFADTGAVVGTATSVTMWDRQVFVGVSGPFGRLRLGRQYSPHFVALAGSDPFGANAVFSPLGVMFGRDGQTNLVTFPVRLNNMLGYSSPKLGGFTAEIAYAPGESASASKRSGEGMSLALSYRQGPAFVALSASRMRGGTAAAPVADPSTTDFLSLSGSYKLGNLTAYGIWMQTITNAAATEDARHINLGLSYQAAPLLTLSVGVTQRDVKHLDRDATVLTLGADYALSRRTGLYARALNLSNDGTAANAAARTVINANSGDDVRGYALGIRHSF